MYRVQLDYPGRGHRLQAQTLGKANALSQAGITANPSIVRRRAERRASRLARHHVDIGHPGLVGDTRTYRKDTVNMEFNVSTDSDLPVTVISLRRAAGNMFDIRRYIRQFNPEAAKSTAKRILESVRAVSLHPHIPRPGHTVSHRLHDLRRNARDRRCSARSADHRLGRETAPGMIEPGVASFLALAINERGGGAGPRRGARCAGARTSGRAPTPGRTRQPPGEGGP